jgi:hypothetical protein
MGRRNDHSKKRPPSSKYARRRQQRAGRGPKTEAELKQQKYIRDARRRKRQRKAPEKHFGENPETVPEISNVQTHN